MIDKILDKINALNEVPDFLCVGFHEHTALRDAGRTYVDVDNVEKLRMTGIKIVRMQEKYSHLSIGYKIA